MNNTNTTFIASSSFVKLNHLKASSTSKYVFFFSIECLRLRMSSCSLSLHSYFWTITPVNHKLVTKLKSYRVNVTFFPKFSKLIMSDLSSLTSLDKEWWNNRSLMTMSTFSNGPKMVLLNISICSLVSLFFITAQISCGHGIKRW